MRESGAVPCDACQGKRRGVILALTCHLERCKKRRSCPVIHRHHFCMSPRYARFSVHLAAILFGLTGIFGELIQSGAAVITLGRAVFAVLALALFARAGRRAVVHGMTGRKLCVLAAAGALLALHWVTFFISVKVGSIAIATLGFASFPAFITLFEVVVLRQRIQRAEWSTLVLVTAGLILVTPTFDIRDSGVIGLLWGLASGLSFAMLAIVNRYAAAGINSLQVAGWQNLIVVCLLLPFAAAPLAAAPMMDWLWLMLLGVVCTGLSHYLFVASLSTLSARSAGMVIALEPVYAIVFAWGLFNQIPSLRMLSGATLVVVAIIWSGLHKGNVQEMQEDG